jgi:hypothetical protein
LINGCHNTVTTTRTLYQPSNRYSTTRKKTINELCASLQPVVAMIAWQRSMSQPQTPPLSRADTRISHRLPTTAITTTSSLLPSVALTASASYYHNHNHHRMDPPSGKCVVADDIEGRGRLKIRKQQLLCLSSANFRTEIAAATTTPTQGSSAECNNERKSTHSPPSSAPEGAITTGLAATSSSLLPPTSRSIANTNHRSDERVMMMPPTVGSSSSLFASFGEDGLAAAAAAEGHSSSSAALVQQQQQQQQQQEQQTPRDQHQEPVTHTPSSTKQKQDPEQQIPGEDGTIRVPSGSGYRIMKPFPWRLHEILGDVQQKNLDWIISWRDDGKSFQVHCQKSFTDVIIPMFFRHSRYKSFQRQLYLYGFRTLETPAMERGCYFHPKFIREDRSLSRFIVRVKAEAPSTVSKTTNNSGEGKKHKLSKKRKLICSTVKDSPGSSTVKTVSATMSTDVVAYSYSNNFPSSSLTGSNRVAQLLFLPQSINQAPVTTSTNVNAAFSTLQSQKINIDELRTTTTRDALHRIPTRHGQFSNGLLGFSDEIISIFGAHRGASDTKGRSTAYSSEKQT